MLANSRRALEAAAWRESLLLQRVDLDNDLRRRLLFSIATHELQGAAKQQSYQSARCRISSRPQRFRAVLCEIAVCASKTSIARSAERQSPRRLLSIEVTKIRDEHHGSMVTYVYACI